MIRTERRKELAFENKTYWDLKRWRIIDTEAEQKTASIASYVLLLGGR
ncbi:MAG: RagB/SusD family nutrient uptake outer membrane protein [Bacteroides cellulosilyticus]